MATDIEKARVTELHVRMDCNGCVQKIKKAMHSIDGVYDMYVDYPQQKITVVGRVDPEVLVKAIKKTKKTATICSHTDPTSTEPASQPPSEAPPAETTPLTEPPADAPPAEAHKESPETNSSSQEPKDVEEVHMVHHYPHNYVYREHWNNYTPIGHETRQPDHVMHSYNSQRPSPYVSEYVAEYVHKSPPRDMRYHGSGAYGDGYYQNRGGDGNQITSIFSDENPNACKIV